MVPSERERGRTPRLVIQSSKVEAEPTKQSIQSDIITVGVYTVMVCRWTDHILSLNLKRKDLSLARDNFPTRFSLINLESHE